MHTSPAAPATDHTPGPLPTASRRRPRVLARFLSPPRSRAGSQARTRARTRARSWRAGATATLVTIALAAAACDDGTGVEIVELAGFWNATLFVYDDDTGSHPGFGIDVVSDWGGGVTLDVAEDGTFTGSLTIPEVTVDPATGETRTLEIGGSLSIVDPDRLRFDFDSATEGLPPGFLADFTADFVLAGNVLSFTTDEVTFDFPDSFEQSFLDTTRGVVDATLEARFER